MTMTFEQFAQIPLGCAVSPGSGVCSPEDPCEIHNCATVDSDDGTCGCTDDEGWPV